MKQRISIIVISLIFSNLICNSQEEELKEYFNNNNTIFKKNYDTDQCFFFDTTTIKKYRIFLSGEAHYKQGNEEIEYQLITYLHKYANVRIVLWETGYAEAFNYNQFLKNDEASTYTYTQKLKEYYNTLPDNKKIKIVGIDYERDRFHTHKALFNIFHDYDNIDTVGAIRSYYEFKQWLDSTTWKNPKKLFNQKMEILVKEIEQNRKAYKKILKKHFFDVEMIIQAHFSKLKFRRSSGLEKFKQREEEMYKAIIRVFEYYPTVNFFGQFGINHIYLNSIKHPEIKKERNSLTSMLNHKDDSPVKGQISVLEILYSDRRLKKHYKKMNYYGMDKESFLKLKELSPQESYTHIKLEENHQIFSRTYNNYFHYFIWNK